MYLSSYGYVFLAFWIVLGIGMISGIIKFFLDQRLKKKAYNNVGEDMEKVIAVDYNGTYILMTNEQFLTYWRQMTRKEKKEMVMSEKKAHRQAMIKRRIENNSLEVKKDRKKQPRIVKLKTSK